MTASAALQNLRAAYHEAGHAVVAALLGCHLLRVSILVGERVGCDGFTSFYLPGRSADGCVGAQPPARVLAEIDACVSIAGPVQEEHLFGSSPGDEGDWDAYARALHYYPPDEKRDDRLHARVVRLLSGRKGSAMLERFADALLTHTSLNEEQIRVLVEGQ